MVRMWHVRMNSHPLTLDVSDCFHPLRSPLTLSIMADPCVSKYGHSFERAAILEYLSRGNETCPLSRQPLRMRDIITNHKLRLDIRRWQKENGEDITVIMSPSDYSKRENILGYICVADKDDDPTERTLEDDEFLTDPQETVPQETRRRGLLRGIFRSRS